jgi:hypothetical protein
MEESKQIGEYAVLARETYRAEQHSGPLELPAGWNVNPEILLDSNGNCFCIFINPDKKEAVISVRGTNNLDNLETNINIFLARILKNEFLPPGQDILENLTIELLNSSEAIEENYTYTLVGHSLGGIMAELCAIRLGVTCFSFESPGSLCLMQHYPFQYPLSNYHVVNNYLSAPNCINSMDNHPGKIFRMHLPEYGNIINNKNRSIDNKHTPWYIIVKNMLYQQYRRYVNNIKHFFNKLALQVKKLMRANNPIILVDNINWLIEQHSIENIAEFLLNSGEVQQVDSWPLSPWIELSDELIKIERANTPASQSSLLSLNYEIDIPHSNGGMYFSNTLSRTNGTPDRIGRDDDNATNGNHLPRNRQKCRMS